MQYLVCLNQEREFEELLVNGKLDLLLETSKSHLEQYPNSNIGKYYYLEAIYRKKISDISNIDLPSNLLSPEENSFQVTVDDYYFKTAYRLLMILIIQGKISQALEVSSLIESNFELANGSVVADIENALGILFKLLGDYHKSLVYFQRSKQKTATDSVKYNIADLKIKLGLYSEAEQELNELYIKSLKEGSSLGFLYMTISSLVLLLNKIKKRNESRHYISEFENFIQEQHQSIPYFYISNLWVEFYIGSSRLLERSKAEALIDQILKEGTPNVHSKLRLLLNLVLLKIDEYKMLENKEIEISISKTIAEIEEIAGTENLIPVFVDITLLSAKFQEVLGNFKIVNEKFTLLENLIKSKNYSHFAIRINDEREAFNQRIQAMKKMIDKNKSTFEKLELNSLLDYLDIVKLNI